MMLDLKAPRQLPNGLYYAGAVTIVLILSSTSLIIKSSEAKEFDWNDLGVTLGGPKSSNLSAANLRILVSPQRRSSKNYEFEFTNGSQPTSSGQSDSAYVVSSAGSPYLAQSLYQLSPNHSTGHSSAYSALSASLASLKSRLNARGVTLTSTLADPNGQAPSHIYASTNNAYGSSVIIDPSQHSAASQQQQQTQAQQSPPSAYLSVSGPQQDSQASSPYTVPPSQGNENKTIVLAIPAKINFLTGSKQPTSQQQQQQPQQQQLHQQSVSQTGQQVQQLSVIQSTGMLNAPEGSVEQVGQVAPAEQQEHQQQYLIVNQPQGFSDHHSHSVAANLSPTSVVGPSGHVYSTIYHSAQGLPQASGYAMKYMPTYSQASTVQSQQQPAVHKVYSVIESPQMQSIQQQQAPRPQSQMTVAQQVAPMMQASYEPQMEQVSVQQQPAPISGTRYISCIDTCNSADPRWRKYTVSRYRACCSRSSQFDASYEHPSAEKVGESSARYVEDTYYSYLQNRRSRSKRARRQKGRSQYGSGYGSASASSAAATSGSYPDEEGIDSGSAADGSGRSGSRGSYQETGPTKYYKSRGYGASPSSSLDLGAGEQMSREEAPLVVGKPSSKGRAGRRGRSRDFDAPVESAQPLEDNVEDGSVYPRDPNTRTGSSPTSYSPSLASASGYGSGDHSVDLQGRGYGSDARSTGDEEESTRYDDSSELEPSSGSGKGIEGQDYPSDVSADSNDEPEQDPAAPGSAYKYPSGSGASTYRRKSSKSRRRPAVSKEQPKTYGSYKKSSVRKSKSKYDNGHSSSNSTDYDSAQAGDHYQDSASGSSQDQEDHNTASSYPAKETGSSYESSEPEKESNTGSKYRANINDTAVANLSKTTLHLKEILSILEKKAYAKGNESLFSEQSQKQSQPATSTPLPPVTTTTSSYQLSLLGSPYSSSLSSDFLNADFSGLKSPYKYDHTSFTAGSLGSQPLSLPSSFSQFGSESMTPLSSPYPSSYALHTGGKHMSNPNGPHQRKRRVNKNARYNDLMLQKAAQSLATPSSLLHAKNRFLSPSYYSALQYPYLYRGATQTLTNPYPYKSHHKNPYSSLLSGSMSSKLAAAAANSGNMYADEPRLHGLTGLDPLANMASSLRPSAAMRLRSKPFIFQPQVLPIYTRHSILAQPLEAKA